MIEIVINICEKNGDPIGYFKISHSKWNSKDLGKKSLNLESKDYKITAEVDKSLVIDSPEDMDNKTPIQFLKNPDWNLSQILLLEEKKYDVEFHFNKNANLTESNIKKENIFYSYKKYNSKAFENRYDNIPKREYTAYLYFQGYTGNTIIDIIYNKKEIRIPLEVKSKKINYYNEFYNMIKDLYNFIGLTYDKNSPTNLTFKIDNTNKASFFEQYMLLKNLFKNKNLPYIVEYLSRNLYTRLDEHQETVPTSLASNISADELKNIVSDFKRFENVKSNSSLIRYAIKKDEEHYFPNKIDELTYKDTIDIPENRFYKNFLELVLSRIEYLLKELKKSDDQRRKEDHDFNADRDNYVKKNLIEFKYQTINFLSQSYFNDISRMDYPPLNSQILQKKEGYRDILKYFLMLDSNFKINWISSDSEGSQKKLSDTYEIWCYLKLIEILTDLTEEEKPLESIFDAKEDNWTINLSVDENSHLFFNYKQCLLELMYNQNFNQSSKYYSYSQNYMPDYTLAVYINEKCYYLHFDAKYKVSENEGPKKEDIDKMHTYKDAIKNTKCAYVLYPGHHVPTEYQENKGRYLYSVGAYPLNPGDSESDKEKIKEFIEKAIDEIIDDKNISIMNKVINI